MAPVPQRSVSLLFLSIIILTLTFQKFLLKEVALFVFQPDSILLGRFQSPAYSFIKSQQLYSQAALTYTN